MKKTYLNSFLFCGMALMASCGSSDQKTAAEEVAESKEGESEAPTCVYSLPTPDSTKVTWTAYKTTEKVGVGGSFTEFTLEGLKEGSSVEEAISDASISIPVSSVWTKNPERDERIKTFFFGVMDETSELTGTVKDASEGKGTFTLSMNGMEGELPFTYTMEDGMLSLTSTLDVAGWNGQAAIDALNEECKDLHAGADGITKLWSEVSLVIKTPVKKSCE